MIILDGKKISSDIKSEIKSYVLKKTKKGLRPPHLAAILVGNDGASLTYINSKIKKIIHGLLSQKNYLRLLMLKKNYLAPIFQKTVLTSQKKLLIIYYL